MSQVIVVKEGSGVLVIHPCDDSVEQCIAKLEPGKSYRVVNKSQLPQDREFRPAWTDDFATDTVDVNIVKAKEIAHNRRRFKRDKDFEPLDRKATIPAESTEAETQREAIRVENATVQAQIDAAMTVSELKTILNNYGA